jgi:2-amino-4-hydroxy-6-hydroxymethyldihydropteridine diphosphokinase
LKEVHIGLGSNLGDREDTLRSAVEHISTLPRTEVVRCSSVYETLPWGYEKQPQFLNQVCLLRTSLAPLELLHQFKRIEAEMGRRPHVRYGPRIIDIDILLWGSETIKGPDLEIPHPQLHLREFVLRPLSELSPNMVHPVLKDTVAELLERIEREESAQGRSDPEESRQ